MYIFIIVTCLSLSTMVFEANIEEIMTAEWKSFHSPDGIVLLSLH